MRIALVAPNYFPQTCGVGDYAMRVAEHLIQMGYEAEVLVAGVAECNPDARSVPVRGFSGATPTLTAARMSRYLMQQRPDAVLIQYTPFMLDATRFGSIAVPLIATAMRRLGVHVVLVAHEVYFGWSFRPDISIGAATHRIQLATLMAVVDRVVVTTENRASDLEWMRRLTRQDKIDIVPVGPNVLPVQRKKTDGPFRLGTFSQLSTSKRIDSAIEAFALVAAEVPFSELVLIGDMSGEGLLARRLDVLTRDSPYASRLKKTGRLSLAQIGEHMSQLDVFLFPMVQGMTTRSGTLPVALGSGVPVVGMKGVETSPWFVPDENYVDSGTLKPSQIAAAALRLKREPELGLRVASGGRALFAQHLTWTEIAKALVSGLPSNEKQKELLHEAI